jgi:hypothetical protein
MSGLSIYRWLHPGGAPQFTPASFDSVVRSSRADASACSRCNRVVQTLTATFDPVTRWDLHWMSLSWASCVATGSGFAAGRAALLLHATAHRAARPQTPLAK